MARQLLEGTASQMERRIAHAALTGTITETIAALRKDAPVQMVLLQLERFAHSMD